MSADQSGARWFKSTYSNAGGDCVEVAHIDGGITKVRDSKNPDAGELTFTRSEWAAFVKGAKDGEFDRA